MSTLVLFGAGCIGRGFVAPLFAAAGWEVVVVEVDARLLRGLARGHYRIRERDTCTDRLVEVGPVRMVDGRDHDAVAAAVATADLSATAVGVAALPAVAIGIAAGFAIRIASGGKPLDVLVCENGLLVHDLLRQVVLAAMPDPQRALADARLGCVRTSIGRMIPPPADGIDLTVEPYADLPVEAAAFRGPRPAVPHLLLMDDFGQIIVRKLYLHNLTHACLAYAGHLQGCATIADCVAIPALRVEAQSAAAEVCAAIARRYGEPAGRAAEHQAADLFRRFANPHLCDPVARVARDPWRKLAMDDRLAGAARFCFDQGVPPVAICRHIAQALRYRPADDEPGAARWRTLQAVDPLALLTAASGLASDHPVCIAVTHPTIPEVSMHAAYRAADLLATRSHELSALTVVTGFDGFVDETVQVVDERRNADDWSPIDSLAGLGAWMSACAGRNGLREMVVRRQDAGGCAVNLGDGLIALGLGVECFATIGQPRHPAFNRFATTCRSCTAWGTVYGRTLAFECQDGKAMLSVVEPLARLDATSMTALLADGAYARACTGAAVVALTDWSLFPHMTACWQVLDEQVFARLPRRPRLFVDLVDPGSRSRADIAAMLAMLGHFQHHAEVTLGLNLTETAALGRLLGIGGVQAGPGLGDSARLLRVLLAIDQVVIHSARWNAVADRQGTVVQAAAPFCTAPVRTTGAGDRFNAGYVCALALDLPAPERLAVASTVASIFIRTGASPGINAVIAALRTAGADMALADTDMACGAACV